MITLELSQATAPLSEYARNVKKNPVIVTVNGEPVAALVALENTDAETVSLSTNPQFLAVIERSRARCKAEGGISSTEMRNRLGLRHAAKHT